MSMEELQCACITTPKGIAMLSQGDRRVPLAPVHHAARELWNALARHPEVLGTELSHVAEQGRDNLHRVRAASMSYVTSSLTRRM